jgi:signal transduction histidine kinase
VPTFVWSCRPSPLFATGAAYCCFVKILAYRRIRDIVVDVAVILMALGLGLGMTLGSEAILQPLGGVMAVVQVALALSLAVRRWWPLTVAWIAVAAAALLVLVELVAPGTLIRSDISASVASASPLWATAAPFAIYSALAFGRNRRVAWIPAAVLAGLMVIAIPLFPAIPLENPEATYDTALGIRSVMAVVIGALLGLYVSARRRAVKALTERAERAERERYLLAEQARADERAKLAAEMHDVVTHRVSLMVVQAGALRVTAPDERTRIAAEELRATGAQALRELRDVVGLLRRTPAEEEGKATEPDAPLPDLRPLIAESEATGTPVELVEEGDPTLAAPVVGRTAYRVVQEALTNVRKHAPGARVRVHVRYRTAGLCLTVTNTAPTGAADPMLAGTGSGTGLHGLRERVELVHGTLDAGPEPGGGFRVEATLPAYVPTPEPVR